MKHLLLTLAIAGMTPCHIYAANETDKATEPTFTEWHDLSVNNVNRFATRTSFFAYENREAALKGDRDKSSNFLSIEGDWRFSGWRTPTSVLPISSAPTTTTRHGRLCACRAFGN